MSRTLLLSFAHPDDETFYCAGVTMRYRAEGVRVVLVCATLGQRGSCGKPPICCVEDLPAVRERELATAAEILGITDIELLGYCDQELAAVNPAEIRSKLMTLIRRYRPDVVITFDPNGGNAHTDHVAISRFTTDAVIASADDRWHTDAPAYRVPRLLWTPPTQPWHLHEHGDRASVPGVDFLFDIIPWREKKRAALHAHRTQTPSITRVLLGPADSDERLSFEAFRQVYGPDLPRRPAEDLFAGLPERNG